MGGVVIKLGGVEVEGVRVGWGAMGGMEWGGGV